jgi:hypothetical protein
VNFAMPSTISAAAYQNTGIMTEFTFEVYNGSTRYFHATAKVETGTSETDFKDIVYDKNGSTTTVAYTSSGSSTLSSKSSISQSSAKSQAASIRAVTRSRSPTNTSGSTARTARWAST